jgi:7-cyano-7-deazaguanine reductase
VQDIDQARSAPAQTPAGPAPTPPRLAPGEGAPALGALGARTTYAYDSPRADVLEVFPNPRPGALWAVSLACLEFTALCPVTGQPDYGQLHIDYVPGERCVESKSLKLYLMRYRNHGAFHEACVNQVADDLAGVVVPRYLRVFGDFAPRGGIAIKPIAVREAPDITDVERDRHLRLLSQASDLARAASHR